MTKARQLRRLLERSRPTLVGGVHDGLSAALAERAGFDALWASGFAISASKRLADVGLVTLTEHLAATREIDRASDLPVIADVDDGFGDAVIVTRMVREYEAAGIAAICIEDSRHPKRCSLFGELDRQLVEAEAFAGKIRAAKATQIDPDFIVIARIEALIADLGLDEALARAQLYAAAGADMILMHSKERDPADIKRFGELWDGPQPLVAVPTKYPQVSAPELYEAGYRMVIFANHGLRASIDAMDRVYRKLTETQSLESVEDTITPLGEIFHLVGFDQVREVETRFLRPPVDAAEAARDEESAPAAVTAAHDTLFERLLPPREGASGEDDRVALSCAGRGWSRGELREAVESSAALLHRAGVVPGDRVMLLLQNSPEFVVAFLAIARIGAIVVPVDFQAGPGRLEFIARDTGPRLCLRGPDVDLPAGFHIRHHAVRLEAGGAGLTLEGAASGDAPRGPVPHATPEAPAVVLFSAGSTGRPKGAILEHRHLLRIARTLVEIVGMDAEHRELILSPMTHSGGWQRVTSTLLAGGHVVVADGMLSIPGLLEDVQQHGINGFFAAPPLLRALIRSPGDRVREACGSLRSVESASAPLAPGELGTLMTLLPEVRVLWQYGLTECSRALILDTRAHPDKLHTVGLPTPGVEVQIADAEGRTLAPGERGEILLAAPQRAERYWNRPDLNRERFRGRWLRTGDVGSIDDDGFVTYHGREDDMINCGGMSFFPAEAERELGPLDGVEAYIVAGVPDPKGLMEHVPWAFVVPGDVASWSRGDFTRQARKRLPPHMVPRNVVVLQSMPLLASGKPDRRKIVAEHGPATGGDGGA